MQVIRWGGRYFVELALMFGVTSSPGVFCEGFRLFVVCIILLSGIPGELVEQHLDDVLGVGQNREDDPVHKFHKLFIEEAAFVGFRPDLTDNKEKNQAPETTAVALGVGFDTVAWTFGYNADKLAVILNTLARLERGEELELEQMQSLAGKLNAIRFMIEGSRFNICYVFQSMEGVVGKTSRIHSSEGLRRQARWWRVSILAAQQYCPILHPDEGIPGNFDQVGGNSELGGFHWH